MRSKMLWAAWMGGGGLVIGGVVYAMTRSVGWAVVALLAAGPVLNTVAQMVTQPIKAARGTSRVAVRPTRVGKAARTKR